MQRARGLGQRLAHDPGDPLITSHCPFCGSGQVIGRSDGTISCEFCGQAYIVRVQPAFPGMPQPPGMGPAASDIGPDGGVVDPGMIGPDGQPMDPADAPPPGADPDAGAPPDGEDGPPGDDEEDDGPGGPPPPPKGKGKKKSSRRTAGIPVYPTPGHMSGSDLADHLLDQHGLPVTSPSRRDLARAHDQAHASGSDHSHGEMPAYDLDEGDRAFLKGTGIDAYGARYRGLDGQLLTEDQYARHLAARLSGCHPLVMARMRREATKYTPHVREILPLHMMSHHGWTKAEVRSALEWPEAANALPAHHDGEHAQFADPPPEHRIPHAGDDFSHDLDAPAWQPPPATGRDTGWLRDNGIASRRRGSR